MPDRDLRFFEHVAALKRAGQPFAVAMVVSRRSPVSSQLGDRAVIFADGRMQGFVGGACSREIVRRQALQALTLGSPRLVQIRPDGALNALSPTAEHVVVPMSCASEGAVDVYIEPYARPPLLLVVGFSPVADALVRLGEDLEYEIVRVVGDDERKDLDPSTARVISLQDLGSYVAALSSDARAGLMTVVASQGHYDEPALETLIKAHPLYVGLLASQKRGSVVRVALRERGCAETEVAAIHNPAGLNLGARTSAEVAVSILAEIIQLKPRVDAGASIDATAEGPRAGAMALDPVCHMEVDIAVAPHTADFDGRTYYFCCPHCKARFEKDPTQYLEQAAVS